MPWNDEVLGKVRYIPRVRSIRDALEIAFMGSVIIAASAATIACGVMVWAIVHLIYIGRL